MKKIFNLRSLKIILTAICIVCLVLFLLPVAFAGIINIGNATGIAVFSVLSFCLIKTKIFNQVLVKVFSKKMRKVFLSVCVSFAAIIFLITIVLSGYMIYAVNQTPQPGSTLVVLGCAIRGDEPTLIMQKRLDKAYDYLCENANVKCILSGGKGSDEKISEAECMYRYLIKKGVEPSRLFKEDKSTTTRENILFSKEIIKQNGLEEKIVLVSAEFHQARARMIANSLSMESYALCATTPVWLFPTYYVRELYGMLYQMVF